MTGTCHGPVLNDGGEVIIEGVVDGPVDEQAGHTVIAPTASIATAQSQAPATRSRSIIN